MSNDSGAATAAKKSKSEVPPEVVNMTDGRLVEFAGKRRMIKESFISDAGEISTRLDFRNGQTRTFVMPDSLKAKFAAHGAEQKYGDETAGVDDVDDMILAVEELDEYIQKGEWSTRAEGNGMAGTSVLAKALVEFSGKTMEVIKTYLKGKSQKEKVALRNNKDIKPIVERLEAEKAAKGPVVVVDLGELAALPDAA